MAWEAAFLAGGGMKGRVFVYEFMCGGGMAGEELHVDVAVEGLAMLLASAEDFSSAGFHTFTTLDPRLLYLKRIFEARSVSVVERGLLEGVEEADWVLLIAPETGGTLCELTRTLERSGCSVLGSSSNGVALATDKGRTLELAGEAGLSVPLTLTAKSVEEAVGRAWEVGFPAVFKPVDGVGCEGVSVARGEDDVRGAAELASAASGTGEILVQEYVKGVDASASLIVGDDEATPLTLNAQMILIGEDGRIRYGGGYLPLKHGLEKEALKAAEKAALQIPGLKGYVGVDLVLSRRGVFIMEVNPRLTTSYLGVREVVEGNIAGFIFDSCLRGVTPGRVVVRGGAAFRKTSTREVCDWEVSINERHRFIVCRGGSIDEALVKAGIRPRRANL